LFSKVIQKLSHFLDIQTGEAYRVGVMASLLFFLIAANNLIKIVRDSIFLSHHAVSELPYLYILVALYPGCLPRRCNHRHLYKIYSNPLRHPAYFRNERDHSLEYNVLLVALNLF
jgi:hypothetical protein